MRAVFAAVLSLFIASTALALESCPGGTVIPSAGGMITGNTCDALNGYQPQHVSRFAVAPDEGGVWILPAGMVARIALAADFHAIAELRDLQGRSTCDGPVYAHARTPRRLADEYGPFEVSWPFQVVVDGQTRGACGNYTVTVTPVTPTP